MPNYDYKCPACNLKIEVSRSIAAPDNELYCPDCEALMSKQVVFSSVHFKGSGFYGTDYKGK